MSATSTPVLHILTANTISNKKSTLPFDLALRDAVRRRGAERGPQKEDRGQEQGPRVHLQGSAGGWILFGRVSGSLLSAGVAPRGFKGFVSHVDRSGMASINAANVPTMAPSEPRRSHEYAPHTRDALTWISSVTLQEWELFQV